jgi:hypothetical protein
LWARNPVGIGLKRIKIQSWNFLKTDIIFQRYEEFEQKEEPGAESVIQYLWIRIQKANYGSAGSGSATPALKLFSRQHFSS